MTNFLKVHYTHIHVYLFKTFTFTIVRNKIFHCLCLSLDLVKIILKYCHFLVNYYFRGATTIYITYIGNRISSYNYVLIVVYHSHVSLFEVVSKILVIIISQAYLAIEKSVYCEIPLREVPTALICSFFCLQNIKFYTMLECLFLTRFQVKSNDLQMY